MSTTNQNFTKPEHGTAQAHPSAPAYIVYVQFARVIVEIFVLLWAMNPFVSEGVNKDIIIIIIGLSILSPFIAHLILQSVVFIKFKKGKWDSWISSINIYSLGVVIPFVVIYAWLLGISRLQNQVLLWALGISIPEAAVSIFMIVAMNMIRRKSSHNSQDDNPTAADNARESDREELEYMQLSRQDTQQVPQVETVQQSQAQQYPRLPKAPETASSVKLPHQSTLVTIQLIRVILESFPFVHSIGGIISLSGTPLGGPLVVLIVLIILLPYEAHLILQFIAVLQLIRGVRLSWVRNINICSLVLAPIMIFHMREYVHILLIPGATPYREEISIFSAIFVVAVEVALCITMIVVTHKVLKKKAVSK